MKILWTILTIGVLCSSALGFLTKNKFHTEIEPKCYGYKNNLELINGQTQPIPSSLEAFVSIVERLEGGQYSYSVERIVSSLIARFRFDDLQYKIYQQVNQAEFVTRGDEKVRTLHLIFEQLFGGTMNNELRDNDLTDEEKCALYFMISHTVNDTVLPGDTRETVSLNNGDVLKQPIEQGVVNLNGKTRNAFALGKVLQGILASLYGSEKTYSAVDIFKKLSPVNKEVPEALKDLNLNVLYGVTVSDIIARATYNRKSSGFSTDDSCLLPNGYWDDSVCPTKYILDDNNLYYATHALVRGAVHGLLLGTKIQELRDQGVQIQLSQLLRLYFSTGTPGFDEITWCNSHSTFKNLQETVVDEATKYYKLYLALFDDLRLTDDINQRISETYSQILTSSRTLFDEINDESDGCRQVSSGSKVCETPRDISAVLDYKSISETQKNMQLEIIGNLSVGLFMGPEGSSMAVYTNLRNSGGGYKLHTINVTDISGCPSCATKYFGHFDTVTSTTQNEEDVLRDLNRTIVSDDLPDEMDDDAGVPAKVLLYFNYGNPQNTYQLRNGIWEFRKNHQGTKIFAIGSKKDALKPYVENVDFDIFTQTDARSIVTSLKERVCKVPAQFQFQKCYTHSPSDENNNIFQGYITPYHIQYWAMYPRYFLKSYNIEMTFSVTSGQLKVCFSRNYNSIYGSSTPSANPLCQNVDEKQPIIFRERNPCKGYDVYNCNPFYFSIEATNAPDSKCTEKNCKTPGQIQFEFKHTGISCNRGISMSAVNPMTLAVAVFLSLYAMFKQ